MLHCPTRVLYVRRNRGRCGSILPVLFSISAAGATWGQEAICRIWPGTHRHTNRCRVSDHLSALSAAPENSGNYTVSCQTFDDYFFQPFQNCRTRLLDGIILLSLYRFTLHYHHGGNCVRVLGIQFERWVSVLHLIIGMWQSLQAQAVSAVMESI